MAPTPGREWNYFCIIVQLANSKKVQCKLCNKEFGAASATRLRAHLTVSQ